MDYDTISLSSGGIMPLSYRANHRESGRVTPNQKKGLYVFIARTGFKSEANWIPARVMSRQIKNAQL